MAQEEYQSPSDTILVINCGSSSLKFARYSFSSTGSGDEQEQVDFLGSVERIGEPGSLFQVADGPDGRPGVRRPIPVRDHAEALNVVLDWLDDQTGGHP